MNLKERGPIPVGKSLLERVKSEDDNGRTVASSPSCALAAAKPCCQGHGYQVLVENDQMQARLCDCVKSCSKCYGLARQVEGGFSKACHTPAPDTVISILKQSGIPPRHALAQLGQFDNHSGNGRKVIEECRAYVNQFSPATKHGLLLAGSVGVGKTYILVALTKALAARGVSVKFVDFFELLSALKAGYSQDKSDADLIAPLLAVDVLVIDELGKGRNNDWELTILDQLIMGRYNLKKPVIASTNYQLKAGASSHAYNVDLERELGMRSGAFSSDQFGPLESRVGQRVFSRLVESMVFLELTGQDMRRLKRPT